MFPRSLLLPASPLAVGSVTLALTLTLTFALAGCRKDPVAGAMPTTSASAPASASASQAGPMEGPPKRGGPFALALAPTSGTAAVDIEIKKAQAAVEARKLDPSSDYWTVLGRAWIRKARETQDPGYFQNAAAVASVILEANANSILGLGLRAQVELNRHDFRDAKGTAETILGKKDDDLIALGVLADATLELGEIEESERAVQRMLNLKPNLASYIRASYLKWLHHDSPGAKEAARLAIDAGNDRSDPEPLAWTLVQAALIFWQQGDVAGAEAGFAKALGTFADFPPALVGKGRVALARGDGKLAVSYLEKAYRLSPLAETAWALADAQTMAGDLDGAKKTQATLEKTAKLADPRTLGVFWAVRKEHPEEALALLQNERKHRGDLATLDGLAWALHRVGKDKEALVESDRARRLGTQEAALSFHAGAIRLALGGAKAAEGKKLLQEAFKLRSALDPASAAELATLLGETSGTPSASSPIPSKAAAKP
jgi:tetratricopeptide (TPR) repeat protein